MPVVTTAVNMLIASMVGHGGDAGQTDPDSGGRRFETVILLAALGDTTGQAPDPRTGHDVAFCNRAAVTTALKPGQPFDQVTTGITKLRWSRAQLATLHSRRTPRRFTYASGRAFVRLGSSESHMACSGLVLPDLVCEALPCVGAECQHWPILVLRVADCAATAG
jgi:hypothetical protein